MIATAPITQARAQSTTGVGDDAVPISAHGSRISIAGLWTHYDSRFAPSATGSKKGGLYDGFSRENLGVADLPIFAPTETNIRSLSGLGTGFQLSLGTLEARGDVSKSITPFKIDYGVTNRLSISVLVPYVETTSNNKFTLNRGGAGATVGQNPARESASNSARTANTTLATQLEASRTALASEIARCATVTETGGACAAVRADPAGAQTLLSQAANFSTQMSAVYGTNTVEGAPVVPIASSPAQKAIEAQLAALRTSFITFSSNALDIGAKPIAATVIYGPASFNAIVRDTAFGLAYDTLMNGGRAGIGDVEVSATFLVLNTLGPSQVNRLNASRKAVRTSVTGGWRFGTATGGRSGNPFDLPTGDGANALLIRSTTDLIWSRRFWVSGTVRYAKPLTDNVVTRFPVTNDTSFFRPSAELPVERTLGALTEIEVAPRLGIGRSFGISMAYAIGHQSASTLSANNVAEFGLDGGTAFNYSTTAITVQSLQLGASYSTLNGFVRGKSKWPLEIIYSHGLTLAGSGGVVPATVSDRIELRIYTRFPRR
ncbi:MAG: hypothetical protein ABJB74_05715 [Gemmatimonas sp.]